jgi:uncharacterized membrane protein YhiD involved in acid resistance
MFDNLPSINLFPATVSEIILNIMVALLCGLFIARLYKATYRGTGYSVAFTNSIVMLAMITSLIIMVIGNNLARAFGLVGALSIIRFRTAVKDTQDIVFIFFGLSMGLASGAGFHKIAIVGTLTIGLILYFLSKSPLLTARQKEYLLQFACSSIGDDTSMYMPVIEKYCKHHKVINVKSIEGHDLLELSYYVRFKDESKSDDFIRALQKLPGIKDINLYFDEEDV